MGIQETKKAKFIGPIWDQAFMPEYAVTEKLIDGIGMVKSIPQGIILESLAMPSRLKHIILGLCIYGNFSTTLHCGND